MHCAVNLSLVRRYDVSGSQAVESETKMRSEIRWVCWPAPAGLSTALPAQDFALQTRRGAVDRLHPASGPASINSR